MASLRCDICAVVPATILDAAQHELLHLPLDDDDEQVDAAFECRYCRRRFTRGHGHAVAGIIHYEGGATMLIQPDTSTPDQIKDAATRCKQNFGDTAPPMRDPSMAAYMIHLYNAFQKRY